MYKLRKSDYGVLAALVYSDLFSHPLTVSEIRRYAGVKISEQMTRGVLLSLFPLIREKKGYFFLSGRQKLVSDRLGGKPAARRKHLLAQSLVVKLAWIPTVQFIGLSGRVAAGSTTDDDDIDLFVITKRHTVFTTRFFLLLMLQFYGLRRLRNGTDQKDKICLNFLIDETQLPLPSERQDLYTAREIAQLVPLFERNHTYGRFIQANQWLSTYLPNFTPRNSGITEAQQPLLLTLGERLLSLIIWEKCMRKWQLGMIQKHRTTETVTRHFLAFHPRDYRQRTMKDFQRRMDLYTQIWAKNITDHESDFLDKATNFFYTA